MNIWIAFAWTSDQDAPAVWHGANLKSEAELWVLRQRDYYDRDSSLLTNRISFVRRMSRSAETDTRLRIAAERFMAHYKRFLNPKR